MHPTEELVVGARLQSRSGALYEGSRLPVWRPRQAGDSLQLRVPVPEDGEYRIHFVARLDPHGCVARVNWDGEPAQLRTGSSTIDLYRPHRTILRNFTLERRQLSVGTHTLELVFEGAEEGVERPEIGIDFVWVQKLE